MPWTIQKRDDGKFDVVGEDGKPSNKTPYATRAEARKYMQALYANSPDAKHAMLDLLEAMKLGRRNSATDQSRIQAVHDLMCELGAECSTPTGAPGAAAEPEPEPPAEEDDTEEPEEGDQKPVQNSDQKPVQKPKQKSAQLSVKDVSLDERIGRIRSQLWDKINPPQPVLMTSGQENPTTGGWIEYIYENYAIVRKSNEHYRIDYTADADGSLTSCGEPAKVEMTWTPAKSWLFRQPVNLSYAKSLGLVLPDQDLTEKLAVKKVGKDEIGGYLALWGDPKTTDLDREFFTKETDFWDEPLKSFTRPLTWDHAQDEATKADPVIGQITEMGDDEVGRWYAAKLKRSHQYRKAVEALIEQKAIGTSSDSAPQYVVREKSGRAVWLKRWPLFAAALTEVPCEPRMVGTLNFKALGLELPSPEASVEQVRAMVARAKRLFDFTDTFLL